MEIAAKPNPGKADAPRKSGAGKFLLLFVLALVVLIGAAVGVQMLLRSQNQLTTDNVKITANLHAIAPTGAGKLRKLMVKTGDTVSRDQIIGLVENGGYLRSPIDGEVVECDAAQGQLVSPGKAVCVIADTRDIYAQANIEETTIRRIRPGESVTVRLDAYPGQTYTGTVREVDSITQTALSGNLMSYTTSGTYTKVTQLIPIKIDVQGVALNNLIGTNATVSIELN